VTERENPADQIVSATELTALHDEALSRYGGRPGILHDGCVERAIAAAWHAEEYAGSEEVGLVFAGYLMYYLATDHCFRDGNKRTSWSSGMRVLSHFDLTVEATAEQAYEFMCEVARGREGPIGGGDNVVKWLAPRLIEVPAPAAPPQ
jgi:death-on-curing protein